MGKSAPFPNLPAINGNQCSLNGIRVSSEGLASEKKGMVKFL